MYTRSNVIGAALYFGYLRSFTSQLLVSKQEETCKQRRSSFISVSFLFKCIFKLARKVFVMIIIILKHMVHNAQ